MGFFFAATLILGCMSVSLAAETYDYIIVGGGTAGLVVANRLSELSDINVLILEAGSSALNSYVSSEVGVYGTFPGPVNEPTDNVMGTYAIAEANSINWDYVTVPQKYARGEVQHLPAGRGVGGSSLVNGMVYSRAVIAQIDAWQLAGNDGWNWDSLLQYSMKSESFYDPGEAGVVDGLSFDPRVHGTEGFLSTSFSSKQLVADEYYPSALNSSYQKVEVPFNKDLNTGVMRGFSTVPLTLNHTSGRDVRADSGRSYYYPVSSRSNLRLIENITVRKLIWTDSNEPDSDITAVGVEALMSNGTVQTFLASREVVLSCGSFGTPPILERSGIGNPSLLSEYDIDVRVDLPGVGENLMDQASSNITNNLATNVKDGLGTFAAYLNVYDIFGQNASTFRSTVEEALPSYAEEITSLNNNSTGLDDMLNLLKIQHSLIFDALVPMVEVLHHAKEDILTSEFWSTMPFARGQIHITSNDTLSRPEITTNYWMFPYDLATSIGAARFIRRLVGPESEQESIGDELTPGTTTLEFDSSDAGYEQWLKSNYHTAYHGVGSAIMLPRAMGGVVSNHTLVYGTTNVRVIDASIIPFQTNGHTQAIVYALAEHASDIIKTDGGL